MAKVRKTSLEKLDSAIREVIEEWGVEEAVAVKQVTKKIGKEGTKLLKAYSKADFKQHSRTKTYYKQWKSTVINETQDGIEIVIHSKKYQLPHLLEYSHKVGKSGFYQGRPHIARAEKEIKDAYVREVKKAL